MPPAILPPYNTEVEVVHFLGHYRRSMSFNNLLSDYPPPDKDTLLKWCDEQGIERNHALEVCDMEDGSGWRVMSTSTLEIGEYICQVPKTAILSTRTSSLPYFESSETEALLHLSLALLHEFRLGIESRFYGYIQSLPRETVLLPQFWEMEDLCGEDGKNGLVWLKGTEAEGEMRKKETEGLSLDDIKSYYSTYLSRLPPTTSHSISSPLASFLHAYSLISTRAFVIDLYHRISLVPFADLMNHSSEPHTLLATDDFVCHICGSLPVCVHDIRHPLTGMIARLEHLPESEIRRLGVGMEMVDGRDMVEMRVERPLDAGEEVFNSYANDLGDAKLLVEWGFVGGEYTGQGITWAFEILSSLGGGGESTEVFDDFMELARGVVESAQEDDETGDDDGDDDDHLLSLSSALNLNHSAQLSSTLFLFTHLTIAYPNLKSSTSQTKTLKATETDLQAVLKEMEDVWKESQELDHQVDDVVSDDGSEEDEEDGGYEEYETSRLKLRKTAKAVKNLIQARIGSTHRPELSQSQLLDLKDELPHNSNLERMALEICIDERGILLAALEKWRTVDTFLK